MFRTSFSRRRLLASAPALATLGLAPVSWASAAGAQEASPDLQPKPASAATKAANDALRDYLDFTDTRDFENARRGFIARPETLTIRDADGNVAWDLESYKTYITPDAPAPDTVNPSLWRNAQLNMEYGLFQVSERIYQVRGYDLSNVTFVQGETGWIIMDTGSTLETTTAAYELVTANLGSRPVVGVVYSHSHGDHYGGVRALVDEADVVAGKVPILAPDGFTEHAISEFVIAGNAMARRAVYMYGPLLPRNPQGGVNAGLGQTTSLGTVGLILPTRLIKQTGEEVTIDGVQMVFQVTPGTEAPAEMNTYFPQFRAMWMAENTTNTLHNILTLRGAQVRDAKKWADYLNETIELYTAGTDVKFQSHHWPMWGQENILDYWKKQRDMYRYIHARSVYLLNNGYTGVEIANLVKPPAEVDTQFYNRGYYGSVKHNSRAVYQYYMGFYDAHPATLDQLPPEEAAVKYVEYMGGAEAIITKARADYDNGEYRWVAEALRHVVFSDPENMTARALMADAFEQMGYQAESGSWRSVYLQGASELRHGIPPGLPVLETAGPDTVRAMPPDMVFDYLSVRLNADRAAGKVIGINMAFTDLGETYGLVVEHSVLNHGRPLDAPDVTVTLTKSDLDAFQLGEVSLEEAIAAGDVVLEGDQAALTDFLSLIDVFEPWFNIVTP